MVPEDHPSPAPILLSPANDEAIQVGSYGSKGAIALLMNGRGQLLLQLRDDNPAIPYPGTWGLLGGVIEVGETAEEALRRELLEEIEFVPGELTMIGHFTIPSQHTLILYVGTINKHIEDLPLHEGAAIQYFHTEELPNLKMAPHLKDVLLGYLLNDRTPGRE